MVNNWNYAGMVCASTLGHGVVKTISWERPYKLLNSQGKSEKSIFGVWKGGI